MNTTCPTTIKRPSLNYHLATVSKAPDDLRHLMVDLSRAAKYISYAIQTTESGLSGSTNEFGEAQLKLDILSDELIRQTLCENGSVACYSSEETSNLVELTTNGSFTVVYDPLDGSSLVDANLAIGSIFGIYRGRDVIGRTPREQVAALYVLYGPRTILVYSTGHGVHEFILNDVGEFIVLSEHLGIGDEATSYSPGNLRVIDENPAYGELMQQWLRTGLTLRYSGCMVADLHHILRKGQGIFTNVGSLGGGKYPQGKLRLLYECGPFAYLAEQAGGSASTGLQPLLNTTIESYAQRTPIIIGSKNAVQAACTMLQAQKNHV